MTPTTTTLSSSSTSVDNEQQQQQQQKQQRSQRKILRWIVRLFYTTLCILCIILCPYTKVEESFNIQGSYDLLYNGYPPIRILSSNTSTATSPSYDHLQYPGVVPRTFTGPILLTTILNIPRYKYNRIYNYLQIRNSTTTMTGDSYDVVVDGIDPLVLQGCIRFLVLVLILYCWDGLIQSIDRLINQNSILGSYIYILLSCQFHLTFYSSRLLPNTFAVIFALRCYSHWITAYGIQQKFKIIQLSIQNTVNTTANTATTNLTNYQQQKQLLFLEKIRTKLQTKYNFEMSASLFDILLAFFIFRCDLLLLVGPLVLLWFVTQQITILQCIMVGCMVVFGIVPITIVLDTRLWQKSWWYWPEFIVFYFNVILNKSSNYGVMVWHWYYTSALPKALLGSFVLVPIGCINLHAIFGQSIKDDTAAPTIQSNQQQQPKLSLLQSLLPKWIDTTWLQFLIPALAFVTLYSKLGHKEVRFLFPVLPLFTIVAAVGFYKIHLLTFNTVTTTTPVVVIKDNPKPPKQQQQSSTTVQSVLFNILFKKRLVYYGILFGLLLPSFLVSCIFIAVSKENYPGGYALQKLITHVLTTEDIPEHQNILTVYIDNAAAMSGVTLFGQQAAQYRTTKSHKKYRWNFYKAGYEEENSILIAANGTTTTDNFSTYAIDHNFSYLIMDVNDITDPLLQYYTVVHTEKGYPKLNIRTVSIQTYDAIAILQRK